MTEIQNQTGTKKKLLIPVVVLMLLLVSFAGAAYAYSARVSVDNNELDANSLQIDLADGTRASITPSTKPVLTFTDNIGYAAAAKSNTVKYEVQAYKLTYNLNVTGDAKADELVIMSTDVAGAGCLGKTLIDTKTIGTYVKFQVSVKIGAGEESVKKDLNASGATFTGLGHTTTDTAVQVFVYAVAVGNASGDLATFSPVTTPVAASEYAAYYASLVDNAKFTLTIDAQPTA